MTASEIERQKFTRRDVIKLGLPVASLLWLGTGSTATAAVQRTHRHIRAFLGDADDLGPELRALLRDREVRRFILKEAKPLLRELAEGLETTQVSPTDQLPIGILTDQERENVRTQLVDSLPALLADGPTDEPAPDDRTIRSIIDNAIEEMQGILCAPKLDTHIALINQGQDFRASVVDNLFIALDQRGPGAILIAPAQLIGQEPAQDAGTEGIEVIVLLISLVIELLGLVAGLAGLTLPKVPLGPVAKALLPHLKSPTVRTAITVLLATLASKTATIAQKAEAVFRFLTLLAAAGALSRLVAELVRDLGWTDYLAIGLRLIAFIATFFISAGTLTIARIAAVLATSLFEIISKVDDLVERK